MCMSCRTIVINNYDLINILSFLTCFFHKKSNAHDFLHCVSPLMSSRVACGRLCPARSPHLYHNEVWRYPRRWSEAASRFGLEITPRDPAGNHYREFEKSYVAIRTKLWPNSSKFNRNNHLPIPSNSFFGLFYDASCYKFIPSG